MKHPKVEIYQEAAKPTLSESDPPLEWRWRLKAANGTSGCHECGGGVR